MPMTRRQIRHLSLSTLFALTPVVLPSLAYWVTGGGSFQWRLALSAVAWAAAVYTQSVAVTRKKKRFLMGAALLYFIGATFSFTVLGPVSVAFLVLHEGLLVMLWTHRHPETLSPAHILAPVVSVLTGVILALGVLAIRLSI